MSRGTRSKVYTLDGDIIGIDELYDHKVPFFRKYTDNDLEKRIVSKIMAKADPRLIRIYSITDEYCDFEMLNPRYADTRTVHRDISANLNLLHSMNIIYLDFKPDNFGWSEIDRCWKIFDFDTSGICDPSNSYRLLYPPHGVPFVAKKFKFIFGLLSWYTIDKLIWKWCRL